MKVRSAVLYDELDFMYYVQFRDNCIAKNVLRRLRLAEINTHFVSGETSFVSGEMTFVPGSRP